MALDLLSVRGLHGEIPRRYRHEVESFTWCLICLYFATTKDSKGENRTRSPHPLQRWFTNWESSLDAKFALQWRDHDVGGVHLAHPNTRDLAYALHEYWVDRYKKQFPRFQPKADNAPQRFARLLDIDPVVSSTGNPLYEEPGDDRIFREMLIKHESALYAEQLQDIGDDLFKMTSKYKETDWHA